MMGIRVLHADEQRVALARLAALRRDDRPVAVHELRPVLPDPKPEPEAEGVAEPARRLGDVRVGEDRDDGGIRDGAVPAHGALAAQASISIDICGHGSVWTTTSVDAGRTSPRKCALTAA